MLISASLPISMAMDDGAVDDARSNEEVDRPKTSTSLQFILEDYYYNVRQQWQERQVPIGTSDIYMPAHEITAQSDDATIEVATYKGQDDVVIWTGSRGWIEYEVDVAEAGLYEFAVDYYPLPRDEGGSRRAVQISMQLNGEFPYREARAIDLYREFRDIWPLRRDKEGNDLRPQVEELAGWKHAPFRDAEGSYSLPLLWHLEQGRNTIRLALINEPVAIAGLTLRQPTEIPTYEQYAASQPAMTQQGSHLIEIDAQVMSAKNETSLQVEYERDPLVTPLSYDRIRYNTVGGFRWQSKSQAATWEFDVPQSGYYKLSFRSYQGFTKNKTSHRNIYINGEMLFDELIAYPFMYNTRWDGYELVDDDGDLFEIYLEEGLNTITLEATHSPYMPIISEMDSITSEIRDMSLDIRNVTSGREDSIRRWRIEEDIPGLTDRLHDVQTRLEKMATHMTEVNGIPDNVSRSFEAAASDIASLLRKPNEIPNKELAIGSLQERIETQRNVLMSKPLLLDKIYIASLDQDFPKMQASLLQRMKGSVQTFYYSFFDRDSLSNIEDDQLNVWFFMGRDYVNELQALANERFTPEHGVNVRVNLIQQPDLLIMANAAGIMPDIALGVPGGMPYDMALRGAAVDLSQLPGADELFERYTPGSLMPFHHDGGMYGIPETMQFKVLFYRTDILNELGLEVPNTWEDVYDMLPTLVQNNYNFFMEPRDFSFLFYQHGVDLYSADGDATGLDTKEAFETYKRWTDFYNIYGLERQVQSFYNQFRRGYLPIGIADFNQYMQLLVAAPELRGYWGIAPMPGVMNDDGVIERWSGGIPDISGAGGSSMTAVMLFEGSDEEMQDHAWEFAKWYTSTEIQTEFGNNLEQYNGEQFRWNAANIEAFANMPWKQEDLDIILEQWRWFKDFPNTPGSYMTGREMNFAWIRTVIDGENYRTSLEKAIREINRELRRKQEEFGLLDEHGQLKEPISMINIDKPWTGVDQYAR